MSFYERISPQQEPSDLGTDEVGRAVYGFNVLATRSKSITFEEELIAFLVAEGVVTSGLIFGGTQAKLPGSTTSSPFLTVIATGGPSPLYNHGEGVARLRSTAQIAAHGASSVAAKALAFAAYDALAGVTNQTLNP